MRIVPFEVVLTWIPFPEPAPEEFCKTAPLFKIISSVDAALSPTFKPGTAVLPLGRISVMVLPLSGVIVNLLITMLVPPVGKLTV